MGETQLEEKTVTRTVPMWKVIMHNDSVTTMEFVMTVLLRYFGHDSDSAFRLMMQIHEEGMGIAGIYPLEVAELKKEQAESEARTSKYPLKLTLERA